MFHHKLFIVVIYFKKRNHNHRTKHHSSGFRQKFVSKFTHVDYVRNSNETQAGAHRQNLNSRLKNLYMSMVVCTNLFYSKYFAYDLVHNSFIYLYIWCNFKLIVLPFSLWEVYCSVSHCANLGAVIKISMRPLYVARQHLKGKN